MVREGLLTSKEAESHPRRNVLQRSMGVGESVEIDVLKPLDLQPGDTFVLCSDGLHGLVREPEMLEVAQLPIQTAVEEFVKRALDRGAPDNVTVVVARVEGEPGSGPAAPAADVKRPSDESDVDTAKMAAINDPEAVSASSGAGKILLIIAVAALAAAAVAWLLGYRPDVDAIRRIFGR
jgi:serine/threonine protein phosphatase PrpC